MKLELEVSPFKDYQTEIRFKSCLNYVIDHFYEVEPLIQEYWLKSELNYVIDHFYEVEPLIQEYWLKSELKKLEAEKKKKQEKDKER